MIALFAARGIRPVRRSTFALLTVVAQALAGIATASNGAGVGVAVLPLSKHEQVQALVDLFEVRVAGEPSIHLLERREIDVLLREQSIALEGLVDSENALRVGGLLKADLLVMLDALPEVQGSFVFIALDVPTGRRLWDEVIASDSLDGCAGEMLARLHQAQAKRMSQDGATVCVLGGRNADLPRANNAFVQNLVRLVERRLASSPQVSLLERSHLDAWRNEQALQADRDRLRAATRLVEVEISRGTNEDHLMIRGVLTDANGKELGVAVAESTHELGAAAEQLCVALLAELRLASPAHPQDLHVEAARFFQEGVRLETQLEADRAHERFHAAHALAPDSMEFRQRLFVAQLERAVRMSATDLLGSLQLVEEALDVTEAPAFELTHRHRRPVTDYLLKNNRKLLTDDGTRQQTREIHARTLRRFDIGVHGSSTNLQWPDILMAACSADSFEYVQHAAAQIRRWAAHYADPAKEWSAYLHRMGTLWMKPGTMIWPRRDEIRFDRDETFLRGLLDVSVQMSKSPDRLIALLGELGRLYHDVEVHQLDDDALLARWELLLGSAEPYIRELREAPQGATEAKRRAEAYWVLLEAADFVKDPETRFGLYRRLFEFVMQNRDVSYIVFWTATSDAYTDHRNIGDFTGLSGPRRELSSERYPLLLEMCDRVLDAMRDPSFAHPDPWGWTRDGSMYLSRRDQYRKRVVPPTGQPAEKTVLRVEWQGGATPISRVALSMDQAAVYVFIKKVSSAEKSLNPYTLQAGMFGLDVVRIDLSSGARSELGVIPAFDARDAVEFEGRLFVATTDGLWACSLSGGPPTRIGERELPSQYISSLACVGRALYVGAGYDTEGSYFLKYSLEDMSMVNIASSERKQPRTPFDNISPGAFIRRIHPDEERSRLVLVVDRGGDANNMNDYQPLIGIWSYALDSGTFTQHVHVNRRMWSGEVQDGRFLFSPYSGNPWQPGRMHRPWYGVLEYDMEKDACEFLCSFEGRPAGPDLNPQPSTVSSGFKYLPPFYRQEGRLFFSAGSSVGWMDMPDATIYALPPPEPNQIFPLNNGRRLLMANQKLVWWVDTESVVADAPLKW